MSAKPRLFWIEARLRDDVKTELATSILVNIPAGTDQDHAVELAKLRICAEVERYFAAEAVQTLYSKPDPNSIFSIPVSELDLPIRPRKALLRLGIADIGELMLRSVRELLATKNCGAVSVDIIQRELAKLGLKLPEEPHRRKLEDFLAKPHSAAAPAAAGESS